MITSTTSGVWELDDTYAKINAERWRPSQESFQLYVSGAGDYGRLGLNNNIPRSSPTQVPGTQWEMIYTSRYGPNLAYKSDGTLWSWGYTNSGSLGVNISGALYRSSPVQIPGTQWTYNKYLHSGYLQKLSTKSDGTLWSWGYNGWGELGQNDRIDRSSPVQIPGTQWSQVFRGIRKTWATKTDGTLWAWGYDTYGSLGLNTNGVPRSSPTQIPGTQWKQISGNYYNAIATKTDGTLWSWGRDQGGCLGLNANGVIYSSPIQIPGTQWDVAYTDNSNWTSTIARKTDGTLWAFGYGDSGILAQNSLTQYSSPQQIPGTQWSDEITMSHGIGGAIKTDGTLWVWGVGSSGAFGLNDAINRSSPVQIPGTQWYRIRADDRSIYVIKQILSY